MKFRFMIPLFLMAVLLSACLPDTDKESVPEVVEIIETPVPTKKPTEVPSATLEPTATPVPPTPTPTIEAPVHLEDFLQDVQLTFYDNFDYQQSDNWTMNQECQSVSNGELEYACTNGFLERDYTFQVGEGVMIDFKAVDHSSDFYWGINMSNGSWGEDTWRNFGISDSDRGQAVHINYKDAWQGFNISWIKPDIWYSLLLGVGEDGRIVVLVWERDTPDVKLLKHRTTLGSEWADREWWFWVNNDQMATLVFDNFYQLNFTEIK